MLIKYCVFSQEFSIFRDLSLARTGLLLVIQVDYTLRSQIKLVALLIAGDGLHAVKEKKFNEHPVYNVLKPKALSTYRIRCGALKKCVIYVYTLDQKYEILFKRRFRARGKRLHGNSQGEGGLPPYLPHQVASPSHTLGSL